MAETYSRSGVDIDRGDRFVSDITEIVKGTFTPGVVGGFGGFSAAFRMPKGYRRPVLVSCTDGVGTKLLVADLVRRYDTVGQDLVAMVVNDMITCGARPLFFLDYLACDRIDLPQATALLRGIAAACREADCALVGGETAELPGIYPPRGYDLAGFGVGVAEEDALVDGSRVTPGTVLVGLPSSGLHSNGYSLVRHVLFDEAKLSTDAPFGGSTLGEALLSPTRIYVRLVLDLLEKHAADVVGMAHITGGGLEGNACRMVGEGMRLSIDTSAWEVPAIFRLVQEKGNVDDGEMRRVFNMGIGYVLFVRAKAAEKVMAYLSNRGEKSVRIGVVEEERA